MVDETLILQVIAELIKAINAALDAATTMGWTVQLRLTEEGRITTKEIARR